MAKKVKREIKGFLAITSPMEFIKGNMANSISIFDHKTTVKEWYNIGEISIPIEIDYDDMTQNILEGLQKLEKEVIAEHELKLNAIKEKRATFLALAAPIDNPAPEEDDGLDPNYPPF